MGIFDLTKVIRMGLLAVGALTAWGVVVWRHDSRVVETERARVEKKSNANAQKAETARRSADKLPPDRLRDKYFRD